MQVSAAGVRTGAGFYEASGERLASFRDAIASDLTGPELAKILAKLERSGVTVGGDRLKTTPRGYDAEHPRIELLRHKTLKRRAASSGSAGDLDAEAARPGPQGLARLPAARRCESAVTVVRTVGCRLMPARSGRR